MEQQERKEDDVEASDGILQLIGRIDYASIPKPPDYDEHMHRAVSDAFHEWLIEHRKLIKQAEDRL